MEQVVAAMGHGDGGVSGGSGCVGWGAGVGVVLEEVEVVGGGGCCGGGCWRWGTNTEALGMH